MASFDELKAKYQSVLKVVKDKHVQIANLHMQDNKLFIKGTAPSQEAANAVWDEMKRINPKMDDILADLPIDTSLQASAERVYKVKAGDTLSKISQQLLGDANKYMLIFEANRDKLKDPDKIQVGQELKIPGA